MKISYGITVHNEADELHRLLDILNMYIDSEDEIVYEANLTNANSTTSSRLKVGNYTSLIEDKVSWTILI